MRIDTLIRLAISGEVPPDPNAKEQEVKSNSQLTEKGSVQLDTEKLKVIDELSRLILELKNKFPELVRNLERARDHISVNQENIPIKKILNLLSAIQQSITDKTAATEPIRNLVGEVVKTLQPKLNLEIPPETKLILVLSKNDFESANTIIRNITATPVTTPVTTSQQQQLQPQSQTQAPPQTLPLPQQQPQPQPQQQQSQLQPQQQPSPLQPQQSQLQPQQQPSPLQPQQSQPQSQLQPQQIPQTQQTVQSPQQAPQAPVQVSSQLPLPPSSQPYTTPPAPQPSIQTQLPLPQPVSQPLPQPSLPLTSSLPLPQLPQLPPQTFQTILNVLQEFKELGIPKELQTAPLKELETIVLQRTGIEVPKDLAKNLSVALGEKPVFAEVITRPLPQRELPQAANTMVYEVSLPKNFPMEKILPDFPKNIPIPLKIELAFSLHQIPDQTKPVEPKFILQPWPASIPIPTEERNLWLKTGLPFTPQTLELRENILSFNNGKLPESPELIRTFASALHEVSVQTEQGTSVPKDQANLLWRVVNNMPINLPLPTQITQTFMKYQAQGNYEGELFKNLPEPIKKELLQELPKEKTLQPEVLQKAVERVLEKAPEEMRPVLQNLKEQIQWTRIDQDTRVQSDKENIFYFMHEGELQKGRLKVKDERKGGSKDKRESSISFSIDTKVKNLGNVHVDLTLTKGILNIRMQDEVGTASEVINAERETLAKELTDIGLSLGELIYGKTPKIQAVKVAEKTEKNTGGLDVKA